VLSSPSPGPLSTIVHTRPLLIANPTARRRDPSGALDRLRTGLDAEARETAGDGRDVERIAAWLEEQRPRLVIAAGGDGTVRAVACALIRQDPAARAMLGLAPLGTANNVARSLGQGRLGADPTALLATLRAGRGRPLDLGRANGEWFVGSCAAGMDASILAARNRWRRRWQLGPTLGGYPLYLLACAAGLAAHRPVDAQLACDGAPPRHTPLHNLLVLNTGLYAGEFRFDAADHSADGRLDLLAFAAAGEYVRGFVTAWRRQLGAAVPPAPLRRIERLSATFAAPTRLQLDGEEAGMVARLDIDIVPAAIQVVLD
jgi:diacylglycerol kinase family enzyme